MTCCAHVMTRRGRHALLLPFLANCAAAWRLPGTPATTREQGSSRSTLQSSPFQSSPFQSSPFQSSPFQFQSGFRWPDQVATHHRSTATFSVKVDLGDDRGVVHTFLEPLFSASTLLTVRYPLPALIRAVPSSGVLRVSTSGNGLREGDVLRCCTTFHRRMEYFSPLRVSSWGSLKPAKCLFLCDGQTPERVIEALCANSPDRASDIVMLFERPQPSERPSMY